MRKKNNGIIIQVPEDNSPVNLPDDDASITKEQSVHMGRSQRNKLSRQQGAKKKVLWGSVIGGSLIAGLICGLVIGNLTTSNNSFGSNAENVTGELSFDEIAYPEGWSVSKADTDVSTTSSSRNPLAGKLNSCTFTPSTIFISKEKQGLDSEYLSRNILLARFEGHKNLGKPVNSNIKLDGKKVGAVEIQGENLFAVARVFDGEVQEVPKDLKTSPPHGFETVLDKGLPASALVYSCLKNEDFSLDEARSLVKQVNVLSKPSDK